jgi:hypothetical protein
LSAYHAPLGLPASTIFQQIGATNITLSASHIPDNLLAFEEYSRWRWPSSEPSLLGAAITRTGKRIFGARDGRAEMGGRGLGRTVETELRLVFLRNGARFAHVSAETGNIGPAREWVVADAVYVERVSATKFPANREINRENRKIQPAAVKRSPFNAASMGVFGDIPCEN